MAAGDNPERLHSEAAGAHLRAWLRCRRVRAKPTARSMPATAATARPTARFGASSSSVSRMTPRLGLTSTVASKRDAAREVIRILKRYVAREVYRYLPRGQITGLRVCQARTSNARSLLRDDWSRGRTMRHSGNLAAKQSWLIPSLSASEPLALWVSWMGSARHKQPEIPGPTTWELVQPERAICSLWVTWNRWLRLM